MAGDSSMELLFLDTFKHQSAEVNDKILHISLSFKAVSIKVLRAKFTSYFLFYYFLFFLSDVLLNKASQLAAWLNALAYPYVQKLAY